MPLKADTNQNIKTFMTTQEKSTGKTKPLEHKTNDNKQLNICSNMVKEASPTESKQRHKAPKNTKENKTSIDTKQTMTSAKHDGNPEKKQRENIATNYSTETNNEIIDMEKTQTEEHIQIPKESDKTPIQSSASAYVQKENNPTQHTDEVQSTSIQLLVNELKSIKETILHLDAKVDTSYKELTKNTSENAELTKLITAQNAQITTLLTDNNVLKQRNKTLEKDLKEFEEEILRLKVDITGIPESPYETFEHLREKIAEIMMPVSEGKTNQARWETSINIPIMDCRRLGIYNRNKKRTVRVTFLFMKHKICLLSRKSNLPEGIYIDNAFPESIK